MDAPREQLSTEERMEELDDFLVNGLDSLDEQHSSIFWETVYILDAVNLLPQWKAQELNMSNMNWRQDCRRNLGRIAAVCDPTYIAWAFEHDFTVYDFVYIFVQKREQIHCYEDAYREMCALR